MQVRFESRDPHLAELREGVVERLQRVLRRLGWLVPRARIQLAGTDVTGAPGLRCRIELATRRPKGVVVVTALSRDWRTAVESALGRAVRACLAAWRRSRTAARTRSRSRPVIPRLPKGATG